MMMWRSPNVLMAPATSPSTAAAVVTSVAMYSACPPFARTTSCVGGPPSRGSGRLSGKAGIAVHHPQELDNAAHPIERPDLGFQRGQRIQHHELSRLNGFRHRHDAVDLADIRELPIPVGAVARYKHQRAGGHRPH